MLTKKPGKEYQWVNGTTWHPTRWFGNEQVINPEVECFEVEWDANGVPTLTGNKRVMSIHQALATQRAQ